MTIYLLLAAALFGIGLFGLIVYASILRKILALHRERDHLVARR